MWRRLPLVMPLVIPGLLAVLTGTVTRAVAGLALPTALAASAGWSAMRQSVVTGASALSGSRAEAVGDRDPDGPVTVRDAPQSVATEAGVGVRDAVVAPMPAWSWS